MQEQVRVVQTTSMCAVCYGAVAVVCVVCESSPFFWDREMRVHECVCACACAFDMSSYLLNLCNRPAEQRWEALVWFFGQDWHLGQLHVHAQQHSTQKRSMQSDRKFQMVNNYTNNNKKKQNTRTLRINAHFRDCKCLCIPRGWGQTNIPCDCTRAGKTSKAKRNAHLSIVAGSCAVVEWFGRMRGEWSGRVTAARKCQTNPPSTSARASCGHV